MKEGDYIIAVNGQPTNEMDNIYEPLVNTAGKQVTLQGQRRSRKTEGSRETVVMPIADERAAVLSTIGCEATSRR